MANNFKVYGNVVGVPNPKLDVYTKSEINTRLNEKADKSDITNVYKFFGSVEKFNDLPFKYDLIPNGVPTHNGVKCGDYDGETHTVTIDETVLSGHEDRIIIPIVPIDVVAGKYFTDSVYYGNAYIGKLCTYVCGAGGETYEELSAGVIDHIEIFTPHGEETISGTTNYLGYLPKILDSWLIYEDSNFPEIPNGVYEQGAVYNVLSDGMNYAWTGTDWDALGGEHKDVEARANIEELRIYTENLNSGLDTTFSTASEADSRSQDNMGKITELQNQMGDVETALDEIIEIQNSLMGGEAE